MEIARRTSIRIISLLGRFSYYIPLICPSKCICPVNVVLFGLYSEEYSRLLNGLSIVPLLSSHAYYLKYTERRTISIVGTPIPLKSGAGGPQVREHRGDESNQGKSLKISVCKRYTTSARRRGCRETTDTSLDCGL